MCGVGVFVCVCESTFVCVYACVCEHVGLCVCARMCVCVYVCVHECVWCSPYVCPECHFPHTVRMKIKLVVDDIDKMLKNVQRMKNQRR